MHKYPIIWIVVPVFNRKQLTRACLVSLIRQSFEHIRVVVVDDGSVDGTGEMIVEEFPNVLLLRGDGNYFWTKGMNVGVERVLALADEGDYILSLNDDVSVPGDYLERLMETAAQHPQALIGSIVLDSQDLDTIRDGGVRINWLTAKHRQLCWGQSYQEIFKTHTALRGVDVLSGRGTLIPLRVFREIGLYNATQLPHYGADYEFSVRANRRGYSLFVDYRAVVYGEARATGLNNKFARLSWRQFFASYFSLRSANNLYYRWNFARLSCPLPRLLCFYPLDTIRVIGGSVRNQFVRHSSV